MIDDLSPYLQFIIASSMLIFGSNMLIDNCKLLAEKFNISKFVIGVTVLALGTSLPELVVSLSAILKVHPEGDIVIGNIIGSNIANIALVFGSVILIQQLSIDRDNKLRFNLITLILLTFLFNLFLITTNTIQRFEGLILIFILIIYLLVLFTKFSREKLNNHNSISNFRIINILFLIVGFILLKYGSELFVNSAISISKNLGFSNYIGISMTLVALGTSLPELITSIISIIKKEQGLAIGNIIGSNIINISLVGGLSASILNININLDLIRVHLIIFLLLTFFIFIIGYYKIKINRLIGFSFLCIYSYFIIMNFK